MTYSRRAAPWSPHRARPSSRPCHRERGPSSPHGRQHPVDAEKWPLLRIARVNSAYSRNASARRPRSSAPSGFGTDQAQELHCTLLVVWHFQPGARPAVVPEPPLRPCARVRPRVVEARASGLADRRHGPPAPHAPVVVVEIAAPRMTSTSARPAAGPSRIATATARFSSTTGDGSRGRGRRIVRRSRPVGGIGADRVGVHRRNRGLERVAADLARSKRSLHIARPLRDLIPVPQRAVLSARRTRSPSARSARRASIPAAHHRQQSDRLGLGQQFGEQSSQTDRSADRSSRVSDWPDDAGIMLVDTR